MQLVWPKNESNDTIVMGAQVIQTTVNKDATREEWDIEADLLFDRVYTSYASSEVVVYERLMLDSNGTYTFTITNLLGAPEMMTKAGPMVRLININDDLSFDYARISMDVGSIQSITLDPASRKSANKDCVNGSFALIGGNQKCTIYVGV